MDEVALAPLLTQKARNLRAAGALFDALGQPSSDDLARAIRLAQIGTRHQAETLGLDRDAAPLPTIYHDAPSAALLALAQRHGATPTPEAEARIRELDELPDASRVALTRFVDAFLMLDQATQAAYAHADLARLSSLPAPEASASWNGLDDAGVDLAPILRARNALLDTIPPLRDTLPLQRASLLCTPLVVAPAFAFDLAGCDATYTQDVVFLLDVGGIDTYHNNAGGSGFSTLGDPCDLVGLRAAAPLVDLDSGDDHYGNPSAPRSCGANGGSSVGGVGFLLDAGGDDTYTAGPEGTNGGSSGGVGFLLDAGGKDTYTAGSFATNGGGDFAPDVDLSWGLLLDTGGTGDAYSDTNPVCNGSGTDRTVVPKCRGAQIDADVCSDGVDVRTLAACGLGPVRLRV